MAHYITLFFRTLAFTGFRRGELMALTWNDINFTKQNISIKKLVQEVQIINW